jgi:hypothetical protein
MVDVATINRAQPKCGSALRPDDPEFARQLGEASARVQALHGDLHDAYPALKGNLSIPGMLVGQGLAMFVANGLSDDQIVTHVLTIVSEIRQALSKLRPELAVPDDDATRH